MGITDKERDGMHILVSDVRSRGEGDRVEAGKDVSSTAEKPKDLDLHVSSKASQWLTVWATQSDLDDSSNSCSQSYVGELPMGGKKDDDVLKVNGEMKPKFNLPGSGKAGTQTYSFLNHTMVTGLFHIYILLLCYLRLIFVGIRWGHKGQIFIHEAMRGIRNFVGIYGELDQQVGSFRVLFKENIGMDPLEVEPLAVDVSGKLGQEVNRMEGKLLMGEDILKQFSEKGNILFLEGVLERNE